MSKSIKLLVELIEEDKIKIEEVLEACGYKVDIVCTDVHSNYDELIGYDEKIIATKEFR